MNGLLLPFMIFITNPIGITPDMGYPISVYEKYVERGETSPREYSTLEDCAAALSTIRESLTEGLKTGQVMPEYRMVMTHRIASMYCLNADAKPAPRMRELNTQPTYRWRIGTLDEYGSFKGQSLDMRQFKDEISCRRAFEIVVRNQLYLLEKKGSSKAETIRKERTLRESYSCYAVMPKPHWGWR